MAVLLSLLGIAVSVIGALLLFMFKDPKFGHGLVLQDHNPRREKIGARLGLAFVVSGAVLQFVAVLVAMD